MDGGPGFWLAFLGLALGLAGAADTSGEPDDLLAFFEYLGDEEISGEGWNEFFDSLPERPGDSAPAVPGPVANPVERDDEID